MQGTSRRWAEIGADYQELDRRPGDVALIQREQYGVLGYKTRLQSYPELEQVTPVDAHEQFDAQRTYAYLAQLVRRVGHAESQWIRVGWTYRRQEVGVGFDANTCTWLFYDQFDQLIIEMPAKTLTPAHIWSIAVTRSEASTFCRE